MDIIFIFVSILLLLVLTKLGINVKARRLTNSQLRGVERIQQLTDLLGRLQQYRCEVMSCGPESNRIQAITRQISQHRENLHDDLTVYSNERWLGFLDHWSRLKDHPHLQSSEPLSILKQFDAMTNNLLQLIEELADADRLNKQYLTDFPNINLLWREFPLIVENAHKLILLSERRNSGLLDEQGSKKQVMLLKLVLQLSRASLHYVRYNGSPHPRREVLLGLAAKYSHHLQHDLESGNLNQDQVPEAFQQLLSEHLKEFVQAFDRLQT